MIVSRRDFLQTGAALLASPLLPSLRAARRRHQHRLPPALHAYHIAALHSWVPGQRRPSLAGGSSSGCTTTRFRNDLPGLAPKFGFEIAKTVADAGRGRQARRRRGAADRRARAVSQ
jgi:hypothetical protein